MLHKVVVLTSKDVAPVRALSFSDGAKSQGGVRDGDDDPATIHVGVSVNEKIVSVATINHDSSPRNPYLPVWRIRGMATLKEHRGKGYGSKTLRYCIAHIESSNGGLLWGNLRLAAVPFYERHGFVAHDDVFQVNDIDHRYGELLLASRSGA